MLINMTAIYNYPEILDNSSLFPTDDLILFVKKERKDEDQEMFFVSDRGFLEKTEVHNLLWETLAKLKRFEISKKDLKMYLTDRLINTPFALFRINDRKGLFRPHSENLYIKEFPESGPEQTKEQQLIKKLKQKIDELKPGLRK